MTAVEWVLENLISEPHSEEDFNYNSECWDKALKIEKEQMEKLKDFDIWKEWKNKSE